jgi:hypothetical protein
MPEETPVPEETPDPKETPEPEPSPSPELHSPSPPPPPSLPPYCIDGHVNISLAEGCATGSPAINNLGGYGPGTGPPVIRYEGVGSMNGAIDLVVRSTSLYSPRNTRQNGCSRGSSQGLGSLNVLAGSDPVDLQFCLERPTGVPVTVPAFRFTFFDIDHGITLNRLGVTSILGRESVEVSGFTSYKLENNSLVEVNGNTFSSTRFGNLADNPSRPTELTEFQRRLSVTLLFANVHCFNATFAVVNDPHPGKMDPFGRNLLFGGESNMVMPC